jgi:hypothetical protein
VRHDASLNGSFLFEDKVKPAEYGAGLKFAIDHGWLRMHESGTYVKIMPAGAELFAKQYLSSLEVATSPSRAPPKAPNKE